MSTVHMAIENVTEEDELWDTHSIIENMEMYRVLSDNGEDHRVYDEKGTMLRDEQLAATLIDQVIEFAKGE